MEEGASGRASSGCSQPDTEAERKEGAPGTHRGGTHRILAILAWTERDLEDQQLWMDSETPPPGHVGRYWGYTCYAFAQTTPEMTKTALQDHLGHLSKCH